MGNSEKRPYYLPLAATLRAVLQSKKYPKWAGLYARLSGSLFVGMEKGKRGLVRKMRKKMAVSLTVVALAMMLAACGSSGETVDSEAKEEPEVAKEAESEEKSETVEELPEAEEYVSADGTYSVTLLNGLEQSDMQLAANTSMMALEDTGDRAGFSAIAMGSGKATVPGNPESMESLEDYADHLVNMALDGTGMTVDWEDAEAPAIEGVQRCIAREGTARMGLSSGMAYGCYAESADSYYGVLVIGNDDDVEDAKKVLSIKLLDASTAEKDTLDFISSMTAVLDTANGASVLDAYRSLENMGAGEEELSQISSQAVAALSESWGIEDTASLMEMADQLMSEGHNLDALQYLEDYGISEDMERDAVLEKLEGDNASEEDKNAVLAAYDARAAFGDAAISAWDLSRVGTIMGFGYAAGYCTYEEAMDKTLEAAIKAQESFSSWEEFNQSYLYGYVYWTGESMDDADSSAAQRAEIVETLSSQENGTFSVDWNMELKKEW